MAQRWTDAEGPDAAAAATAAVAANGGRVLRVIPGERSGSWKVHLTDVDDAIGPKAERSATPAALRAGVQAGSSAFKHVGPEDDPPTSSDTAAPARPVRRSGPWARIAAGVVVLGAVVIAIEQRQVAADWKNRATAVETEMHEQQADLVNLEKVLERSEATVEDLQNDVERLAAELAEHDDNAVSGSTGE